eukprot:jgi/Astpho2/50/fgenesh1_pg.00001_%23_28_t
MAAANSMQLASGPFSSSTSSRTSGQHHLRRRQCGFLPLNQWLREATRFENAPRWLQLDEMAPVVPLLSLTLDTFKGDFRIAALSSRIAEPVLDAYHQKLAAAASKAPGHRPPSLAAETLQVTEQLLGQFQRASKELNKLQQQVDQHVQALQDDLLQEEEQYKAAIAQLEQGIEQVGDSFQTLDQQLGHIGQTATRIGDRLQSAEGFRTRAQEAMKLLQDMQQFAAADTFDDLSDLYSDPARLAEAAAMTGQMMTLALEVTSSKERVGLDEQQLKASGELAPKGSIERAVQQLEAYRNLLEKRVISQFDSALHQGDLGMMAECAGVMAEFDSSKTVLVQRYISTRPMFTDPKALAQGTMDAHVTDASSAITAMRSLNVLYKALLVSVRDEAVIMEQVFPAADAALARLITRVFEQRVQASLLRLLVPPPPGSTAETLQNYLKLLAEVVKRTTSLAEGLQEIAGSALNVMELAETAFQDALAGHLPLELQWLELLFAARPQTMQALSLQAAQDLFTWNAEAVERCATMSPEEQAAANVRQLFHSSTTVRASGGCLLEQVAQYVVSGLTQALDNCSQASAAPYGVVTVGAITRTNVNKAAVMVFAEGMGRLLEAISVTSSIIKALQQHFAKVVAPHMEDAPAEGATCAAGLAALVHAVEDRVLACLQGGLNALFGLLDRTLTSDQKRLDFRPPEDLAPPLDRPTEACQLATALLAALSSSAPQTLQGSNLTAFNGEARGPPHCWLAACNPRLVGRQTHALLLNHMQRYSFSPTGALRWKRDVTEYTDCMKELGMAAVNERMDELAALANILVVSPDSLLGLVDGSLRLSHQQALKFIRLREDSKTAKVQGQPLLSLFAAD